MSDLKEFYPADENRKKTWEYFKDTEANIKYKQFEPPSITEAKFTDIKLAKIIQQGYRVFYSVLQSSGIDLLKDFNLSWHEFFRCKRLYLFRQRSDAAYLKSYEIVDGIRVPNFPPDILKELAILTKTYFNTNLPYHTAALNYFDNTCKSETKSIQNNLKLFTDECFTSNSD